MRQAVKIYEADLAKVGAESMKDTNTIEKATEVGKASEITAYESHICRVARKPPAEQAASAVKYMALFACVKTDKVLPALLAEIIRMSASGTAASSVLPSPSEAKAGKKRKGT